MEIQKDRAWNDDTIRTMKKAGKSWREIAVAHGYDYDNDKAKEAVRRYARNQSWYHEIVEPPKELEESVTQRKHSDGSVTSSLRTRLDTKRVLTEAELLEIHGFDPEQFRIKAVTSNEWSVTVAEGDRYYNFQSKIVAEPLKGEAELVARLEQIIKDTVVPLSFEPQTVNQTQTESLIIPLADLHFGLNTADDYVNYRADIIERLQRGYKTVLIASLGDHYHVDNFVHTTVKGTRIEDTNLPLAWEESNKFIEPIIQTALTHCDDVRFIYSPGNHDSSVTWAYTVYLATKYPDMTVDNTVEQLKCEMVGDVTVYLTHGHRGKNKLPALCAGLYPTEWGLSSTRLLLTGHLHHLDAKDKIGIVHYQLPSPSKHTEYERDNLFLGNNKGVHLFTLRGDGVRSVEYLGGD